MSADAGAPLERKWTRLAYHRLWLVEQASSLLDFFQRHSIDPAGGFFNLDDDGRAIARQSPTGAPPSRELHSTTRMVHCFVIARLMGRPRAWAFIDHGMSYLWNKHRDTGNGGYFWGVSE